jgi:hypothetical protein
VTGAGSRDRTRDPLITNQVLYQLSYAGVGAIVPVALVLRQAAPAGSVEFAVASLAAAEAAGAGQRFT